MRSFHFSLKCQTQAISLLLRNHFCSCFDLCMQHQDLQSDKLETLTKYKPLPKNQMKKGSYYIMLYTNQLPLILSNLSKDPKEYILPCWIDVYINLRLGILLQHPLGQKFPSIPGWWFWNWGCTHPIRKEQVGWKVPFHCSKSKIGGCSDDALDWEARDTLDIPDWPWILLRGFATAEWGGGASLGVGWVLFFEENMDPRSDVVFPWLELLELADTMPVEEKFEFPRAKPEFP